MGKYRKHEVDLSKYTITPESLLAKLNSGIENIKTVLKSKGVQVSEDEIGKLKNYVTGKWAEYRESVVARLAKASKADPAMLSNSYVQENISVPYLSRILENALKSYDNQLKDFERMGLGKLDSRGAALLFYVNSNGSKIPELSLTNPVSLQKLV